MKLLDDAVIRDRYDVVVVGAGIGGLTAGALLAKQGLDVLLVHDGNRGAHLAQRHFDAAGGDGNRLQSRGFFCAVAAAILLIAGVALPSKVATT